MSSLSCLIINQQAFHIINHQIYQLLFSYILFIQPFTTFTMNFSAYFAIAISMALSVQAQCLPNGGKDNPNALA